MEGERARKETGYLGEQAGTRANLAVFGTWVLVIMLFV